MFGIKNWQYSQLWVKQELVQIFFDFQKILISYWFTEIFDLIQ